MTKTKDLYAYDFYFNGQFVERFKTYKQAKKLITWNENLTYTKNLYEIKTVLLEAKNNESK